MQLKRVIELPQPLKRLELFFTVEIKKKSNHCSIARVVMKSLASERNLEQSSMRIKSYFVPAPGQLL